EMVARFHNAAAAKKAHEDFVARFAKGQRPEEMPEVTVDEALALPQLLKAAGLVPSTSEAHRMLKQGAVKIDGKRTQDRALTLEPGTYVVQVGKRRFARVILT